MERREGTPTDAPAVGPVTFASSRARLGRALPRRDAARRRFRQAAVDDARNGCRPWLARSVQPRVREHDDPEAVVEKAHRAALAHADIIARMPDLAAPIAVHVDASAEGVVDVAPAFAPHEYLPALDLLARGFGEDLSAAKGAGPLQKIARCSNETRGAAVCPIDRGASAVAGRRYRWRTGRRRDRDVRCESSAKAGVREAGGDEQRALDKRLVRHARHRLDDRGEHGVVLVLVMIGVARRPPQRLGE